MVSIKVMILYNSSLSVQQSITGVHIYLCLSVCAVMHKQRMLMRQLHSKQHSRQSMPSRHSMGRAIWCRPRHLPPALALAVALGGRLVPLGTMRTGTEASALPPASLPTNLQDSSLPPLNPPPPPPPSGPMTECSCITAVCITRGSRLHSTCITAFCSQQKPLQPQCPFLSRILHVLSV